MDAKVRAKIWCASPDGEAPVVFDDRFERETSDGVARIVVAARKDWASLMLKLVQDSGKSYSAVYRRQDDDHEERYKSGALSYIELSSLMNRFVDLIELSPWHNFWIYNADADIQVELDEHNLIFVYGRLHECSSLLLHCGFREDRIEVPFPHLHRPVEDLDEQESLMIQSIRKSCDR